MMEINLLPQTERFSGAGRSLEFAIIGAGFVIALLLGVLGWLERQHAQAFRAEAESLAAQAQELQGQLASLQHAVPEAVSAVPDLSDIVVAVQKVLPPGVTVTSVGWQGGQVIVIGTADTLEHIGGYESALAKMPECSSVWVDSASLSENRYSYTVHLTWKTGMP